MNTELFIQYLEKIDHSDHQDEDLTLRSYYRLFILLLEKLSEDENIHFTSLFSRIAYVGAKTKATGADLFLFHTLRRAFENETITAENRKHYIILCRYASIELLNSGLGTAIKHKQTKKELFNYFRPANEAVKSYYPILRGIIVHLNTDQKSFQFIEENNPTHIGKVKFDVSDKNEIFTSQLILLKKFKAFPVHINLIDVESMEDGFFIPKAFVIDPDYLVDVTAIAGAFKFYGTEPLENILNKYLSQEFSRPLLVGNIANFILDELINDPTCRFEDMIPPIFKSAALTFSCLRDEVVTEILKDAQMHYHNLKSCIENEFSRESIETSHVYLEPSFFSRDFGIQGRLDLLHEHRHNRHFDIVELKSGSPFMVNNYGLSVQHYTQTLLYDLIIKSTFEGKKNTSNYILYSKEVEKQLRIAPPLKPQQYEALKVRNELILLEELLSQTGKKESASIIDKINLSHFPKARGFTRSNVENFAQVIKRLDDTEKAYFNSFSGFIAREHRLAKTGENGLTKNNGLASMWLEDKVEKTERFSILYGLIIINNSTDQHIPLLTLQKTDESPSLSRFRIGDIVVLYPEQGSRSVLKNQIFKCSIVEMDELTLTLKLRSRQYNHRIFRDYQYWAIEGDMLDSSFNSMYKNLYQWASAKKEVRELLLGLRKSEDSIDTAKYVSKELTEEQNQLINKIIHARQYFLLWGPPGTGKTSLMIKHLVRYLYLHTDECILLLSYTNKAVDEISSAVLEALEGDPECFLRVGSFHACDPIYREFLLDNNLENLHSRHSVLKYLSKKRIVVSTISSVLNRQELFHLYHFNQVIVDEASQILEPMIVGLLTRFSKITLIGDHKQLPAVVVQSNESTNITDPLLLSKGISNASTSFFERLYMQCRDNNWNHSIGVLTAQGRMHEELMHFPNEHFYEGRLSTIKGVERLHQPLNDRFKSDSDHILLQKRILFIPSKTDEELSWKTNVHEAEICIYVLRQLMELYQKNQWTVNEDTVGIITPYRAQIALIIQKMQKHFDKDVYRNITVDTVERYQGGARDNIIISLCTNRLDQLESMTSLSEEGVDRKLNVALTRARERIIITGNEEILGQNTTYRRLIQSYYKWELTD